jgi:hypothetical protein
VVEAELIITVEPLSRRMNNAVNAMAREIGEAAATKARSSSAFEDQSGITRSNIEGGATGDFRAGTLVIFVRCTAPWALYLDAGTRPHTITPRNAPRLSWEGNNGRIYARKVNHPGTQPTRFISGSIDMERAADRLLRAAARTVR